MKWKRIIIILMMALLITSTAYAGILDIIKDVVIGITTSGPPTPHTVYTPKGTAVSCLKINKEISNTEKARLTTNAKYFWPQVTILRDSTGYYNCHSYAWISQSSTNRIWLNSPEQTKFWTDKSYIERIVLWPEIRGNKIRYDRADHSAITYSTNGDRIVISKWGKGPLVRHYAWDCPYHVYGMQYLTEYIRN